MFERDGILLADNEFITRGEDEPLDDARVRYRTVGDMTCTGAVASTATTVDEVIGEIVGHADHRAGPDPRRRPGQ